MMYAMAANVLSNTGAAQAQIYKSSWSGFCWNACRERALALEKGCFFFAATNHFVFACAIFSFFSAGRQVRKLNPINFRSNLHLHTATRLQKIGRWWIMMVGMPEKSRSGSRSLTLMRHLTAALWGTKMGKNIAQLAASKPQLASAGFNLGLTILPSLFSPISALNAYLCAPNSI